jgi:DNA-binding CsgD family transcriptional regulator
MAVLVDMAASFTTDELDGDAGGGSHLTPAVVVIDSSGRLLHSSASARRVLADLDEAASVWPTLAPAVVSALARVRERCDDAMVRARGRSGRWYTITASRSEPDSLGDSVAIVVIAPVTRADVAPMLARLYGLTAREREVITAVARGESTKEIAVRLGISAYTVQDHLDHAFDKVGVRGRRALLAKLFLDGTAV